MTSPEIIAPPYVSPDTPRSRIQRRDLGPIIHSWGSLVIAALKEQNLRSNHPWPKESIDYRGAVDVLAHMTREAIDKVVSKNVPAANELTNWLQLNAILTYQRTTASLLSEGLCSAIFVPANTHFYANTLRGRSASIEDYARILRREDFRDTMVRMSHGSNGAWGDVSLHDLTDSTHGYNIDDFFDPIALQDDRYVMSDHLALRLRQGLTYANKPEVANKVPGSQSGGCPVRHRGFPERSVSDFARDFLMRHAMPIPPVEGSSLIEDMLTVQADLLEGSFGT